MKNIDLSIARKRLAVLWATGGLLVFLIFMVCTFTGAYADKLPQAWGWFATNLMPTLTLIFSFVAREMVVEREAHPRVSGFAFGLAFYSSLLYVALLLLTVILSRIPAVYGEAGSLGFLERCSIGLNPLQVLTAAALGGFFASEKKAAAED